MIKLRGWPALLALAVFIAGMVWLWMGAMSGPPEPRVGYAVIFGLVARGVLDWIASWFKRKENPDV